jgi:hypothetical protein
MTIMVYPADAPAYELQGVVGELPLAQSQKLAGGYVEMVRRDHDQQMLVDEEGKLKGRPVNPEATRLATGTGFRHARSPRPGLPR